MGNDTIEAERLRAIERARLRSLAPFERETAERLHADDFQLITPGGGVHSKETYLGKLASGEIRYLVFEADSPIDVRMSESMAALRYRSRLDIVYDGHHAGLRRYWHTDVYERDDTGSWRVVWSQATEDRASVEETT